MADTQLCLATGIPGVLALINLGVVLVLFTDLSHRISGLADRIADRLDALTGAINDLDKRVTRIEIKLGIQP